MSILDRNLETLDYFKTLEDNWNGYGAFPYDKDYSDYVKTIIPYLEEEQQPEIHPCWPRDDCEVNQIVAFEYCSVKDDFYLEMEVHYNDKYKIYFVIRENECKERDGFYLTIPKENLNSVLKLFLNNDSWKQYYEKYMKDKEEN